jgi:hypothetical protein
MTEDIARRRVDALLLEDDYYSRRDALRAELEAHGLSAVATAELRLLEEECTGIDAAHAAQQESEIQAENAWLRAAEYDPRMDDPREW